MKLKNTAIGYCCPQPCEVSWSLFSSTCPTLYLTKLVELDSGVGFTYVTLARGSGVFDAGYNMMLHGANLLRQVKSVERRQMLFW